MKRLLLIDGVNFFYRGAWGGAEIKSIRGEDVSYVLAYFRNLVDLLTWFGCNDQNYYAICWEGGYDERLRISSEAVKAGLIPKTYKQERRESHETEDPEEKAKALSFKRQMKMAREMTNYTVIRQYCVPGEEADDVIGSLANKYKGEFDEVLLVTTDRDYFQLLDGNVRIYSSGKGEFRGLDYLKREYNLDRASQWIDVGALAGEAGAGSDTIYGVPGIGYKTAAKLIAQYGDLKTLEEQSVAALAPDILKCHNDVRQLYADVKAHKYKLKHHIKEMYVLAHKDIVDVALKLKAIRTFLDLDLYDVTPSWVEMDKAFKDFGRGMDKMCDVLTEIGKYGH